ncbi:MAG: hypothetical protein ABMB14_35235 [Myxococcota bacterium]
MIGLVWLVWAAVASAAPFNVSQRFCIFVDIAFKDEDGGDRWFDDSVDKEARGFAVEVRKHNLIGAGSTLVWSGWTEWNGADAGCTPFVTMQHDNAVPQGYRYLVRVRSDGAQVRGNTIHSYTTPANADAAVTDVLVFYSPTVNNIKVYPPPLSGGSEKRWNVLVTAAFALSMHDGDLDSTYTFGQAVDGGDPADDVGYHFSPNLVYLDDRKRWVYMHELGHAVSDYAAGDHAMPFDYTSSTDNCGDAPVDHALLEQEWQSAAAVEGIATWYAEITFNEVYTDADCELAYWRSVDWDNNQSPDTLAAIPHDCIGDPDGSGTFADEVDWLRNLTDAPDSEGCNSVLTNKGVEYEWSRYFWSMVTQHGYSISQIWAVWNGASPSTWDDIGATADVWDDPANRVAVSVWVILGSPPSTEGTDAAEAHGLDH